MVLLVKCCLEATTLKIATKNLQTNMSAFGDDDFSEWYASINLIIAVLGVMVAVITLVVIQRIQYTGHMYLLWYMSFWQLWADMFIFTSNVNFGLGWREASITIDLPTGLASAVVSNWMIYVAYYVVVYRKSFDIFAHINWIWITSLAPGLVTTAVYLIGVAQNDMNLISIAIIDMNNSMRLASIGFNLLLILIIIYNVGNITPRKKLTRKSLKDIAIRTLCYRIVFYPIVQGIGRSGYAWYEYQYGPYRTDDNLTDEKMICLIYLSIMTPLVSIGYLLLLCIMQPQAYTHFYALITCQDADTLETDAFEGSGSTRFTIGSNAMSTRATEFTASTVPSRWFSFRRTQNNHENNQSIISNLSNALMGDQHLSEADSNNSVYSSNHHMTSTPFTNTKPIRSILSITPAAPLKSALVTTATTATTESLMKSTTEGPSRSTPTQSTQLTIATTAVAAATVGAVSVSSQSTSSIPSLRISDRMSQELARRLSHRGDAMSEEDWQEVYRLSMDLSDADLFGLVEDIDEEEEERDSELSPLPYTPRTPPMSFHSQENMFLRDDRMSMLSTVSHHTLRGPSISLMSRPSTVVSSAAQSAATVHTLSPHNTSSTLSSNTNSDTSLAATHARMTEMEMNGFNKQTDIINRIHQNGDV